MARGRPGRFRAPAHGPGGGQGLRMERVTGIAGVFIGAADPDAMVAQLRASGITVSRARGAR
ncbi:MAG: hypothetical protein JWM50_570 [Microbacteriaceae bacterium]|jgi:hypothetical protein|nr:hypothetical protein [Microbacteriaceae bacterium]